MKRIDVIRSLMNSMTNEVVVTSPGMISREVFQVCDRLLNFYVLGSMGATISIGIGVALNTKRDVHVITGDGDVLMDLGSLVLAKKLNLSNLLIHILDNNSYSATGGQPTVSDYVNLKEIGGWCTSVYYIEPGKGDASRIPLTPIQIKQRFMNSLQKK